MPTREVTALCGKSLVLCSRREICNNFFHALNLESLDLFVSSSGVLGGTCTIGTWQERWAYICQRCLVWPVILSCCHSDVISAVEGPSLHTLTLRY